MDNTNGNEPNNPDPYRYPYSPHQDGTYQDGFAQGGYDQPGYPTYPNSEQAGQYDVHLAQGDLGRGVQQPGGAQPPTVPVTTDATGLDIGQALSYGFKGFTRGPAAWIGFMVVFGLVMVLLNTITQGFSPDFTEPIDPGETISVVMGLTTVLTSIVSAIGVVFLTRGAFEIIDGRELEFGDFVKINNWGSIILGILLEWLISLVLIIVFVGAIIVAVLADMTAVAISLFLLALVVMLLIMPFVVYIVPIVIDQAVNPIEALRQNIAIGKSNYFGVLGLVIVQAILQFVGLLLLLVGLVFFMPVGVMMMMHGYRQCIGGRRPVA